MSPAEQKREPGRDAKRDQRPDGGGSVGARVADREELAGTEQERVERDRWAHDIDEPVERGG